MIFDRTSQQGATQVLVAQDVFSRHLWAEPIDEETPVPAFRAIVQRGGSAPHALVVDKDPLFSTAAFPGCCAYSRRGRPVRGPRAERHCHCGPSHRASEEGHGGGHGRREQPHMEHGHAAQCGGRLQQSRAQRSDRSCPEEVEGSNELTYFPQRRNAQDRQKNAAWRESN